VIEAVIFDLDGTLVNLPIDYEALFEEFKNIMHVEDVHPVVNTISRVDAATRAQVFAAWDKAELAVLNKMHVKTEGMKIYQANVDKRKALVTLQGQTVVDAILNQLGLSFDVVVTREAGLFRVDQLIKAGLRLNVNMLDVLFVGNAESDATAAAKLGCQFIKVK
jgi:HAD superfamily hydrolase (TIGR01549 family)